MNTFRKFLSTAALMGVTTLGIIGLAGCEGILNILPPLELATEGALTNTRGLETALIGSYSPSGGLADGALIAGNALKAGELWSDIVFATSPGFGELQIRNRTLNFFNDQGRPIWQTGYSLINRVNNILSAVDNGSITDPTFPANKDRIRGEALFIRGWMYFEIVRYFAQPWGFSTDNNHPGIILRTKPTTSPAGLTQSRATVAAVYSQIINDLQQAEQLLPETNPSGAGRATKSAAAALLARVYFQQNDFTNAATAAGRVIGTGKFSLNADPLGPFRNGGTSEAIFELVSTTQQDASGALIGTFNQADNEPPYLLDPSSPLIPILFPSSGTSSDKRSKCFVSRDGQYYVSKYDVTETKFIMNVPVIRYAEILLIRAEASASAGNSAQALADVNVVRQRAGLAALAGLSGNALLQAIQRERMIELAVEGNRFHELKRLRQNIRSTPWNGNQAIFKIPDVEVNANPNISQNPD
jgi:tetratricopeptide (TPR) repeat protein